MRSDFGMLQWLLMFLLTSSVPLELYAPHTTRAGRVLRKMDADTVTFRRVSSDALWIPEAGWALITEPGRWEKLWRDYGAETTTDDGTIHVPAAPAVDFNHRQVLAVSLGPSSGCSNRIQLVERVIDEPSERVVIINLFHDDAPLVTCGMNIEPVDLVLLPRSPKPIRLAITSDRQGRAPPLPPPAAWWVPLSAAAALDTGRTPAERRAYEVSRRVLPRDPSLPFTDYRILAVAAYQSRDWVIRHKLLRNPRAMSDKTVVAWLAADRDADRTVRLDFLARFGLVVASDPGAPRPWLELLTELLTYHETVGTDGQPRYPEVALALTRNTTILEDSVLAGRLTYATQWYRDVHAAACRAYLERYPATIVFERDSGGAPRVTFTAYCHDAVPGVPR